jgi:aryl-alcohol dehydrogenase-like predicted oxidoreductase
MLQSNLRCYLSSTPGTFHMISPMEKQMEHIILGQSGLDVPVFSVGTAPLAGVPQETGVRILHRAYELGATWWDTSDTYGTESLVGDALSSLPRQDLTISTKTHASQYHEAEEAVKIAQERLGISAIDIMFMHYVQDREDWERRQDCLHAFRDLCMNGAIRAIGFSSHNSEAIRLAAEIEEIDVVLAPWNAYGQMPDGVG